MKYFLIGALCVVLNVEARSQVISSDAPPPELWGPGRPTVVLTETPSTLWARMEFVTETKTLKLSWRWFDVAQNKLLSSAVQTIPLTYYPTSLHKLDDHTFLVAGAYKRGGLWKAVIERRELGPASTSHTFDAESQQWVDAIKFPQLLSAKEVFLTGPTTSQHGLIYGMAKRLDDPDKILVYFSVSRSILTLDLASLTTTELFASTGPSNVPVVTALANNYDQMWSREHQTLGYVYGMMPSVHEEPQGQPNPSWLLFFDSNKDGIIDSNQLVSGAQWISLGYWNASNWKP